MNLVTEILTFSVSITKSEKTEYRDLFIFKTMSQKPTK